MAWLKWLVLVAALLAPLACGDDDGGSSAACGPATCEPTQYCCDAACGLCVAEGTACTDTCP